MKLVRYRVSGDSKHTYQVMVNSMTNLYRRLEQIDVAEKCALNHWHYHQGNKLSYPITITIFDGNNSEPICNIKVDMELEPSFSGYGVVNL